MTRLTVADLGRIRYADALARQQDLVEQVKQDADAAHLLLLEHDPPVITLGRRGQDADIIATDERLRALGVEIHKSTRGGEVTYHGPGQLVAYAIVNLQPRDRNVRGHVAGLEETVIRTLAEFGIPAGRKERLTGVWVGEEKIAAIGVAVHRWVTYHGLALNVSTDLTHFDLIVPCGILDKGVTSMAALLARHVDVADVKPILAEKVREVFGFDR